MFNLHIKYLSFFFGLVSILSFFNIIYSYYLNLYLNLDTYYYTFFISILISIQVRIRTRYRRIRSWHLYRQRSFQVFRQHLWSVRILTRFGMMGVFLSNVCKKRVNLQSGEMSLNSCMGISGPVTAANGRGRALPLSATWSHASWCEAP